MFTGALIDLHAHGAGPGLAVGLLALPLVLAGVACVLDGPWSLGKAADIQMPGFPASR